MNSKERAIQSANGEHFYVIDWYGLILSKHRTLQAAQRTAVPAQSFAIRLDHDVKRGRLLCIPEALPSAYWSAVATCEAQSLDAVQAEYLWQASLENRLLASTMEAQVALASLGGCLDAMNEQRRRVYELIEYEGRRVAKDAQEALREKVRAKRAKALEALEVRNA